MRGQVASPLSVVSSAVLPRVDDALVSGLMGIPWDEASRYMMIGDNEAGSGGGIPRSNATRGYCGNVKKSDAAILGSIESRSVETRDRARDEI